jgi:hypothetical protein
VTANAVVVPELQQVPEGQRLQAQQPLNEIVQETKDGSRPCLLPVRLMELVSTIKDHVWSMKERH